jgi:hypothetical protein
MTSTGPGAVPLSTGTYVYRVEARTDAPVEDVWPLVGEAARWRDWSFLTATGLEREGTPAPDGVGAIRSFTRFGVGSREEVLAWDPPHHLAYRILSGFPVRDYRADVTLEPAGPGTRIEWAGSYRPKVPGTGRLLQMVLPRMMQRFADDVARYASAHRT